MENFKPIVASAGPSGSAEIPAEKVAKLANTNLSLLAEMNKAVGMYEKEAAKS